MPTKSKKYFYRLLAKGRKRKALIAKKLYNVDWDAIYPSQVQYVYAKNEEEARQVLREKINRSAKWHGFIILDDTKARKE